MQGQLIPPQPKLWVEVYRFLAGGTRLVDKTEGLPDADDGSATISYGSRWAAPGVNDILTKPTHSRGVAQPGFRPHTRGDAWRQSASPSTAVIHLSCANNRRQVALRDQ